LTGEVEIEIWDGKVDTGTFEHKILVYSIDTRNYRVLKI
jgi:hypothetical protein